MVRNRSSYDVPRSSPYRGVVAKPVEDEDEVTKPHDLPALSRGDLNSPATGHDILALWDRIDRHSRIRRVTDRNLHDVPGKVDSMALKLRIIWAIGAFLVAGIGASLVTTAKFLYGRGGTETEAAITIRNTADAQADQGRRLRVVEDTMLKILQRLEDTPHRHDAVSGSSSRGNK